MILHPLLLKFCRILVVTALSNCCVYQWNLYRITWHNFFAVTGWIFYPWKNIIHKQQIISLTDSLMSYILLLVILLQILLVNTCSLVILVSYLGLYICTSWYALTPSPFHILRNSCITCMVKLLCVPTERLSDYLEDSVAVTSWIFILGKKTPKKTYQIM